MGEMEELNGQVNLGGSGEVRISRGRRRFGSGGFGSGPGEGRGARQPPCGVGLGDAHLLPEEDLASAMRVFRAPEASVV